MATRGPMVRPGLRVRSPLRVELDQRTAYDFTLVVAGDPGDPSELLPEDRRWLETASRELPPDVRRDDEHTCDHFCVELSRLISTRPEIRTARDLVNAVDQLDDRELSECLFGELLETPDLSTLARRALDGSAGAYAELRAILELSKEVPALAATIDQVAPATRKALHAWLEPFETIEQRVARMQERDAARRRPELPATDDPFGFVERVTNGIRLTPNPRTSRVILAPTYFGRPFNLMTHVGDAEVICYPISDDALDAADRQLPPQSLIRLYRALGDESRLRILRLLTERDWYLTELATELDLSKPTVKHHLAQLRSAGLVTMAEEGALTYYTLRRERTAEVASALSSFLGF